MGPNRNRPAPRGAVVAGEDAMNCPKCGTQLNDAVRFCGSCGTRLAAPSKKVILPSGAPKERPPQLARPAPAARVADSPLASPNQSARQLARGPGAAPAPAPRVASPAPARDPIVPVTSKPAPAPAGPGASGRSADPFIGKVLNGRYAIEAKLGQGGFGSVYRGKQVQIGREVALKVLHPEMARDPSLLARFRREGAVACTLRDAHTVTTYDFDQTPEGTLYIAMELLRGRSLHDLLQKESPVPWRRILGILEEMCSSLGEAHRQGIVHRDIKPENVNIEDRPGHADFVKVLDFGIAKIVRGDIGGGPGDRAAQLTATGQTLGTLEYMSPEQLMGKQLDGRSDLYAMGVLAFELMTGRLPFPEATGPADLIAAQLKRVPPAPSSVRPDARIPPGVDALISKLLEKERGKRFAEADGLAAAIRAVLDNDGQFLPVEHAASALPTAEAPTQENVTSNVRRPAGSPVRGAESPVAAVARAPAPGTRPAGPGASLGTGGVAHAALSLPRAQAPSRTADSLATRGPPGRIWLWVVIAGLVVGGAATAIFFAVSR